MIELSRSKAANASAGTAVGFRDLALVVPAEVSSDDLRALTRQRLSVVSRLGLAFLVAAALAVACTESSPQTQSCAPGTERWASPSSTEGSIPGRPATTTSWFALPISSGA
jgi:hypothetical protein